MTIKLNNGEYLTFPDNEKFYMLAKLLVDAKEGLGHLPSFSEARNIPRMPENLNLYATCFGSFDKACKTASSVVRRKENPEKFKLISELDPNKRAEISRDYQISRIREGVKVSNEKNRRWKMEKREEILKRVLSLCFEEHGNKTAWINESAIKRDPVLILSEVNKAFGGIKQLRDVAERRIKAEKHGQKPEKKTEYQEVKEMTEVKEQVTKVEQTVEQQPKELTQPKAEEPKQKKGHSTKKWTFEEIQRAVREYYEANGKLPTDGYLQAADFMPSPMTARKYLGGKKEEWLIAIGVKQPEATTTTKPETISEVKNSEEPTENGRTIDEIVDLIGEAGKIAKIAESADILESISIVKKYQLDYNGIRICIDVSARKLGQQNA